MLILTMNCATLDWKLVWITQGVPPTLNSHLIPLMINFNLHQKMLQNSTMSASEYLVKKNIFLTRLLQQGFLLCFKIPKWIITWNHKIASFHNWLIKIYHSINSEFSAEILQQILQKNALVFYQTTSALIGIDYPPMRVHIWAANIYFLSMLFGKQSQKNIKKIGNFQQLLI